LWRADQPFEEQELTEEEATSTSVEENALACEQPERRIRTTADMLELQRAIIERLPDAKVVIDEAGRVVMVNPQTELLFGYPRSQLIGQPVEMLLPERLRERHVQHRAHYAEEPRTRPMGIGLNLVGRQKSGREIPVEISLAPIVISSGVYTIAVIRRARRDTARDAVTREGRPEKHGK
jgi:PAS domain S-box-containing protein